MSPNVEAPSVPQHQADATLSQDNPVSGTKYEVLATTKNVRILSISVKCTWTVQPTPLELHVTIDGQAKSASFVNPVSATAGYICINEDNANFAITTTPREGRAFFIEGRSIKVEAEITGGTVSNLSARVKYAKIG